jgi:hypothetical protein
MRITKIGEWFLIACIAGTILCYAVAARAELLPL